MPIPPPVNLQTQSQFSGYPLTITSCEVAGTCDWLNSFSVHIPHDEGESERAIAAAELSVMACVADFKRRAIKLVREYFDGNLQKAEQFARDEAVKRASERTINRERRGKKSDLDDYQVDGSLNLYEVRAIGAAFENQLVDLKFRIEGLQKQIKYLSEQVAYGQASLDQVKPLVAELEELKTKRNSLFEQYRLVSLPECSIPDLRTPPPSETGTGGGGE